MPHLSDCRDRRRRYWPRSDASRSAGRGAAAALPIPNFNGPTSWGTDYYFANQRMAPPDFLDQLATFDAILLGAVGHPQVQDHITLNGLLLPIRRRFDQCVCLRPAFLYEGVESPLRGKVPGSIDMLVFRENTEGEYANVGGRVYQQSNHEIAIQTSVFTRRGCERIIRAAFESTDATASSCRFDQEQRPGYGMVLWDEARRGFQDYPPIETESLLVIAVWSSCAGPNRLTSSWRVTCLATS